MQVIFDIETNGLYRDCTTIHCIALKRIGIDTEPVLFDNNHITEACEILSSADQLIGHNIINYDIPVLEKLYPNFIYTHNVLDTINLSCICYPDRSQHSLESWGKDLGFEKLNPLTGKEFTEEEWKIRKKIKSTSWDTYTDEMGAYCQQDVRITELILWRCNVDDIPKYVIELSNNFAWIISNQIRTGHLIDTEALKRLADTIEVDEKSMYDELIKILPSFTDYSFHTYKRNNSNKGIKAGEIECKEIVTSFNIKSTQHWMRYLKEKYDYDPPLVKRKGKDDPTPCLDDEVLATIENKYPEVHQLLIYKTASKIRGMIYSNPNSVFNLLDKDSVIHGQVKTEGTVSGRCAHTDPNLSTMPGVRKDKNDNIIHGYKGKYAYEVRDLFIARPGFKQVGFDAKALEICCLAHYVNEPEFTEQVAHGDIHTWTQHKAGLHTRKQAKTFMYAFLYGAGKKKLANALSEGSDVKYNVNSVTKVINNFNNSLPGLKRLHERLQSEYRDMHGIIGLDGRLLQARSDYILLNLLLQSTGAVVMKQCLVCLQEELDKIGMIKTIDYNFLLNVHDEVQAEVKPDKLETYKQCVQKAVDHTNEILHMNCPLQIDLKVGRSWAECH